MTVHGVCGERRSGDGDRGVGRSRGDAGVESSGGGGEESIGERAGE
jgi:hypothetical protein